MMSIEQDQVGDVRPTRASATGGRMTTEPADPENVHDGDPVMSGAELRELGRRLKAAVLRDAAAHAQSDREIARKNPGR
jgi:hypothetical protein